MPTLIAVELSSFDHALRVLSIALETAAMIRILQQRLFTSPFVSLACMLGVVLARDIVVSVPNYDTRAYIVAWEWTLFPMLAAQIWAGLDNLRAVARLYPAIGGFAVRLYLSCLAISVAVCSITLPFELRDISGSASFLRSLFLLQRCVDSWIAGTLLLISVYLIRFPAPPTKPPRNLVLNTVLLTIYFGGYAVLFMLENLTPLGGAAVAEQAQFVLVILVYAAWTAGISKAGQSSEPWPRIDVVLVRGLSADR